MDLSSVRVLDLTRLLPGPYGTQLLADLGMDIIKIEDTGSGDYAREINPYPETGVGTTFEAVNRGKRSVALNLKDERGREVFYELVETADVVFESFRPCVVERLGVDYDTLTEYREDLVYCSLSGFGQEGPLSNRVGHDVNYAGLAGFLDMNRRSEDVPPTLPGYPIVDMSSGLFATFCIVAALLDRAFGAGGEYIDVSMSDVLLSFSQYYAGDAFRDEMARPGEARLCGEYPCYGVYETRDGKYVTLAALEEQFWVAFCEVIDREDLLPYHLSEEPAVREELRGELETLFVSDTRDGWEERLSDVDAALLGVYTLPEVLDHPQFTERNLVVNDDEHLPRLGFPAKMHGGLDIDVSLPEQGEHTAAILGEVGYSAKEVAALETDGVVRCD